MKETTVTSQPPAAGLLAALDSHLRTAAAGAAAVGGAFVASEALAPNDAEAAIIYSGPVNINIPSTTAGIYINVVTGNVGTSPAAVPGWDVNPWSSSALNFFNPASPAGGVYVQRTGGGATANLAASTLIGAASAFGNATAQTTGNEPFVLNSDQNLVGFRFVNEANGNQIHFGWMRISLSGTLSAQPRSVVEYAYEDVAGVGILAGDTGVPIPEPAAAALALLAVGAAGAAHWMRRRKAV